jgi:cytochrome c-type biogenesis protein CcmI
MGLFKLLTFPISGPLAIARVLRDEAERQLYDENAIRQQMAEVERQFQGGEIDGEEFERREEELLERLLEARDYHRAKAEDER